MINGSLQYSEDWVDLLRRIATAADTHLYLTRVPVVDKGPGFVAVQRVHGADILHYQFSEPDLLGVVEDTGMQLVREFVVGDRPEIKGALAPCELKGWLFTRKRRREAIR
jgi:hypothetical protein